MSFFLAEKFSITVQKFSKCLKNGNDRIERFHMTSRRPYWCTKNNETAAILVYQTNPVGVEVLSYVNTFFFPIDLHSASHVSENALYEREICVAGTYLYTRVERDNVG